MSPEQLDRVIAVATVRYRAMTPQDHRLARRMARRKRLRAALRRILGL